MADLEEELNGDSSGDSRESIDVDDDSEDITDEQNATLTTQADDESDMDADSGGDEDEDEGEEERDEEQDARMLAHLQQQVANNPYDYESHVQLIKLARISGELEILRMARQRMSELFPLAEDLWRAWIDDEIKIHNKENAADVEKIKALYEKAVLDYLSVDLWLDYIIFSMPDVFDSDEALAPVRAVFERAITAVGLHVAKGGELWDSYRETEQGYLSTLLPAVGEIQTKEKLAKYEKQVERVRDIFRRQLSVPLIGMENTREEFKTFTGQEEVELPIQKLYEKTKKKLDDVLPYEEKLSSATDGEKFGIFVSYIDHEKDPARIILLYERALVPYCLSLDLWNRYLDFLDRQLKISSVALAAHERSIRNIPWTLELWLSYLHAVELFKQDEGVVKGIFDRAYRNGCSLPSHFVELWLAYLSGMKRQLSTKPVTNEGGISASPEVDALRSMFGVAVADLESKGADTENKIEKYWASVEAHTFRDVEKGRALWEKIMKGHQRESQFWLSYYRFERQNNDDTRARKLLKKAVLRNLDNIDAVAMEWMQLESEVGTLEEWMEAHHFCKDSLKRMADRQAKLDKIAAAEAAKEAAPKKNFRLRDSYEDNRENPRDRERPPRQDRERPERMASDDSRSKKPIEKRKHSEDASGSVDNEGFKVPGMPLPAAAAKKQKVSDTAEPEEAMFSQDTPEGNEDDRKVFLSNMSYTTSVKAVKEMFKGAGKIRDIRIVKDLRGKSRGFCYVEYVTPDGVKEALKLDRQDLEGRPVFVSKYSKDNERESHFKGTGGEEKNKLFIRGLLPKVTKEDLTKVFQDFGTLKEIRVVTHKNGISKCIAYVEFADADMANKALEATNGKEIMGKAMSVAISNPPAFTPKQKPEASHFDSANKFLQPNVAPVVDGQRKSRSHVDLVPRAVLKKKIDEEFNVAPIPAGSQAPSSSPAQPSTSAGRRQGNDYFSSLFKKKQ
ncbi:Squamous cell carcinoma antigen recognized by T-cells 3 [Hypsibius exemplaris]|uniref:Squamous cell carcinoma antigen recognized by T-cells 3 n=1 Tax=Hypsibius exemplaris TaxID=2072580 RepID=A0A1W0WMV9_HYPEX|nr:Squamous cell carcinoma antigen recognized by T-cells 3 [Hypsibius exemplaris]